MENQPGGFPDGGQDDKGGRSVEKDRKRKAEMQEKRKGIRALLWMTEGVFVGFGAILPGVSGGTLCVAFGMYRPIIETLAAVRDGLRKYGFMLAVFILGVAVGFVGLSGLAAWLLERNTALVTCAFVGFIAGTFPQLWREAGSRERGRTDIAGMVVCFATMLCVLHLLRSRAAVTITPNAAGYLLCGVLWGLSFIVPGLSSSSLLLFFGLYQPMLAGIARLDWHVLVPMGIGMAVCVLLLSRAVDWAYQRKYALISHGVLGIVAATAVMILPACERSAGAVAAYIACLLGGAVLSYGFTRLCDRLDAKNGAAE